VSIFVRIKTLCFHINALSNALDFALFLQPVNDITYSSSPNPSFAFQCSNVNTSPAPFDNGQDSCGCGYLDWFFGDFGLGFT
jgi:hypothetical protein